MSFALLLNFVLHSHSPGNDNKTILESIEFGRIYHFLLCFHHKIVFWYSKVNEIQA